MDYREHVALKEELSRTDVSEDGALKHARQQVRYFVDTLFIMATRQILPVIGDSFKKGHSFGHNFPLSQASILAHMKEAILLTDGNCFVEMGAGRGHINHWIQRALGNDTNSQFVLVDRQGVRYKMDALHRDANEGNEIQCWQ